MELHLVTAVHRDRFAWLNAAAASVAALRDAMVSTGHTVNWHVVVDGDGAVVDPDPAADTWTCCGHQIGAAAARNLALAATGGSGWVFRLDGDDLVDVDGWAELVTCAEFGRHDWHGTNMVTVDGDRTAHWFDDGRHWPAGSVAEHWTSPMPFHPNNLVVRTDLALAVGGWPAMRVNEDLLWCLLCSEHADGSTIAAVTLRYRRWERQVVADSGYLSAKAEAFTFAEHVINANRRRRGRQPVNAPAAGVAVLYPAHGTNTDGH
jgi:hypothetical protein